MVNVINWLRNAVYLGNWEIVEMKEGKIIGIVTLPKSEYPTKASATAEMDSMIGSLSGWSWKFMTLAEHLNWPHIG